MISQREKQDLPLGIAPHVYQRRWWILSVLCLCVLLVTIDGLILNVALPVLSVALSASASEQQWIVEAYTLVLAGLLLTSGTLTDRIGTQRALVLGLLLFGIASVGAAFAPTTLFLILARAAMGVGGSFIMPATLSTIRIVFRQQERTRAIGIWGATSSLGVVIGPLLGGWLLNHFWWGSVFLVNVVLVLLAVVAFLLLLPNMRSRVVLPIDVVGTVLSFLVMSGLVFGITEAPVLGWTNPLTLGVVAASIILLLGFVVWEKVTAHPMLDLSLFRNPRFSAASFSVVLAYFALMGWIFILTQYLQLVLGYSPLEAGLRLIPQALSILVASVIGAWFVQHIGTRWTVVSGLLITALGLGIFSTLTLSSGYEQTVLAMMISTAGIGLAGTAAADSIMSVASSSRAGSVASVDETALELGGTFGIAVLGSTLAAGYANRLLEAPGLSAAVRTGMQESLGVAVHLATTLGGEEGQRLLTLARSAFVEAMGQTALLAAGVVLVGACIALLFLPPKASVEASPEHAQIQQQKEETPAQIH